MDLPNLFTKQETKPSNLFITLVLTDNSVQSGLWQVVEQKIILSNKSEVRYFGSDEECLIQVDESLQDLGKESEATDEVLLGLEPNWVNEKGILPEHKEKLKAICDKLSLNAVGFVLTTEALHHYLIQKNHYFSSVVLYIGSNFIELVLILQGKKIKSMSVGRSEDIGSDLKEALARLEQGSSHEVKQLPPNLLLASISVSQDKLKQFQQQLLNQDWQQDIKFIQPPVIDVFSQDKLLQIITQQGGKAVVQASGLTYSSEEEEEPLTDTKLAAAENKEMKSFGVPMKEDAKTQTDSEQSAAAEKDSKPKSGSMQTSVSQPIIKPQRIRQPNKLEKNKTIVVLGMIVGLIVLAIVGFFYLKNTYRAKLVLKPVTESLDKETMIIVDPQIEKTDIENKILKARMVTKEVSGTSSVDTSGAKLVGEKAEGTIVIFNKTEEEKSFTAGTKLRGDGIEFVLNEDVTVPAAVVKERPTGDRADLEYGQFETEITASEIGVEGNIAKDTDLRIADFSENTYQARVKNDLSGGSSREIRVVAEEDLQEIFVSLRQRLSRQAKDEFTPDSSNGEYTIPTDIYEVLEEEYSAEVGDEVEQLSLKLTLNVKAVTYSTEDLKLFAKSILQNELPPNYQLIENSLDFSFKPADDPETDDLIALDIQVSGLARAELDESQIRVEIAGLTINEARTNLNYSSLIDEVEILLVPIFSDRLFGIIPNEQQRILIQIK